MSQINPLHCKRCQNAWAMEEARRSAEGLSAAFIIAIVATLALGVYAWLQVV
jgi:uncharacterized protein (DUF983 family)